MSLAKQIFDAAFDPTTHRDPRSDEYKRGVLDALRFRTGEGAPLQGLTPYPLGTAACDAWFSGLTEGHYLWRKYEDMRKQKDADGEA